MNKPYLSVVIPAFNEEKNLQRGSLEKVAEYLSKQDYFYEVLVVDDGSTDDSAKLVEQIIKTKKSFRLIRNEHGGKAISVMTGMLQSKGTVALFTDMDQATPINQIEKFLPKFKEGFDIVIGKRLGRKGAPLIRKVYAFGFSILRNLILGLPVSDTQCGFKAFNRKSVELIFPALLLRWRKSRSTKAAVNAGFDSETLFIANKQRLRISEIPVEWQYVGSERVGLASAVEAFRDMIRIRINDLLGKYD